MKKMMTIALSAALWLGGCSQKEGFFAEDTLYQSALQHTQKGEIYNSLELKASIVATYLNCTAIQCDKNTNEVFLVSIYIDEDSSDESKQGLMNPSYTLRMNGEKPLSVKALSYDDDLIKIAPFRNHWSHYYQVKFPKQEGEKLSLVYTSKMYGSVILDFLKGR